jgi:hypothetical protein
MKSWGTLSQYLHWFGAKNETTEVASWRATAYDDVRQVLHPLWQKICSGQPGFMHPDNAVPEVRQLWLDFRDRKIDLEAAKIRLDLMKPVLSTKYARVINSE